MPTRRAERIRVGAKRQLTIPREALERLRLREGDFVELRLHDDKLELVPLALVPRDQLWFWTPEWQEKEREADDDLATGRSKKDGTARKVITGLKS